MPSKKKQTVGYKYYLGMHMVFCHGPVDALYQILVDKRLAWSGNNVGTQLTIDAEGLFGGESKEGGVSGLVDVEMGGSAQVANSYLSSLLTDVPGFRGVVGLVLRKCYLGMSPYLKTWSALFQRIYLTQGGQPQWYSAKAGIGSGNYAGAVTNEFAFARSITLADHSGQTSGSGLVVTGLDPTATYTFTIADSDGEPIAWRQQNQPLWFTEFIVTANGINYPVNAFVSGSTDREAFEASGPTNAVLGATSASLWFEIPTSTSFNLTAARGPGLFSTITLLDWDPPGPGFFTYTVTRSVGGGAPTTLVSGTTSTFLGDNYVELGVEHVYTVTCSNGQSRTATAIWWGVISGLAGEYIDFNSACVLRWNEPGAYGGGWGFVCFYPFGNVVPAGSNVVWYGGVIPIPTPVYEGGVQVVAYKTTGGSQLLDMNPSHMIRECLTDLDWGMGYAISDIDDVTFTATADTLYSEQFGLSLIWDRQIPIEDFISEIKKTIDAVLYVSRTTGKFVLKLIRADYNEASLLVLDESNIERLEEYSNRTLDELTNSVTVKYVDSLTDRDASVIIQDIAQIQMQGVEINTTVNYPGISNTPLASRVGARDLKGLSTPLIACTIYANTDAKDLNIGDVFKLSWAEYEISEVVMRVADISFGDGVSHLVKINATQDIYATPNTPYTAVGPSDWVDPNVLPTPVQYQIAFEAPYYEVVQQLSQVTAGSTLAANNDAGFATIAAVRSLGAINAILAIDPGTGYTEVDIFNFCPTAVIDSALTPSTISVNISSGINLSAVVVGNYAQINSELIVVSSIVGSLFTFERGTLDTVPIEHASGSRIYFWQDYYGFNNVEYNTAEVIDLKVLPVTGLGQLSLINATTAQITFNQRALKPYPPGNFKINDEYFPTTIEADTIDITWSHRDRLQQTAPTLISFLDTNVGPEVGTTYNGYVYDDDTDVLITSASGITGTTWAPVLNSSARLRIEVESLRGGLVSWQRQSWAFDYIGPNSRLTEIGDVRISETGVSRHTES